MEPTLPTSVPNDKKTNQPAPVHDVRTPVQEQLPTRRDVDAKQQAEIAQQ